MSRFKGPVIAAMPGGREEERKLHRRFARYRVTGEWFRDCGPIRKYIDACASTDGPWKDARTFTIPVRLRLATARRLRHDADIDHRSVSQFVERIPRLYFKAFPQSNLQNIR